MAAEGCQLTFWGQRQQQLKLPANSEKRPQALAGSACGRFSLSVAGFNPAKKFTPKQKYTQPLVQIDIPLLSMIDSP